MRNVQVQEKAGVAELPSLTPLRGLAALWVVFYHYCVLYFAAIHPERYSQFLPKGYLAVDVFFLLSGFVLTHVYDAGSSKVRGGVRRFLIARIARLYPLHLIILIIFVLGSIFFGLLGPRTGNTATAVPVDGPRSLIAFVANLFMLQGLKASVLSWNYPEWSISIECFAYLLLPAGLFLVSRRSWGVLFFFIGCLVFALVALNAWCVGYFNQWDGFTAFWRCLPEFFLGMSIYLLASKIDSISELLSSSALLYIVVILLAVTVHFALSDIAAVLLFSALLPLVVRNRGPLVRLLNSPLLIGLGEISYSLYLIHGLVQHTTRQLLALGGVTDTESLSDSASITLMSGMVAVAVVSAILSYRYVELPAKRAVRCTFDRISCRER
jgi:peptidoglycan/LPS O-acetylase OafA/YrhL